MARTGHCAPGLKRYAMPFSMSPRRSWRSMLTSFGCEQIVQVRAARLDSWRALGLRSLTTYRGPGSGAQPRKRPSIAGVTRRLPRCVVLGLLEFRVLRLGLLQDGDVGIGVFPECEEIFVSGERQDAGGIGIRALRGSCLQGVGTSHSQMRQRPRPAVPDDAAVIENFLKFGGGRVALARSQIGLAPHIRRMHAGKIHEE